MFAVVQFVADGLLCWDGVSMQIKRNGAPRGADATHAARGSLRFRRRPGRLEHCALRYCIPVVPHSAPMAGACAVRRLAQATAHLTPIPASATAPPTHFEASVFAGRFGVAGTAGDGGQAVDALVNNPFGVIRGPDKAIYFCEYDGECVRRVGLDGIISTVAGCVSRTVPSPLNSPEKPSWRGRCGRTGGKGDGGTALEAEFNKPHEIRFGEQQPP